MKTFDDMVHGHKKAKKVLEAVIRRSKQRYYDKCVMGVQDVRDTLKVLLIGPSGTGKTHLIQSLRKLHDFPLITLDATQLMPTGNDEGVNTKQLTKQIIDTANMLLKKNQEANTGRYNSVEGVINQMVIFVDEFDKLGTSFDSSGNWNKHVQANFLTMIDNKEEFSGISWVFAGAFAGVYEKKGEVKNGIGFFQESKEADEEEITDQDIIKAGIIPEILGRISLIVELDRLSKEDFTKILTERLLPNYPGIDVDAEAIVDRAHKSMQGIRSMTRQLEMAAIEHESEWNNFPTISGNLNR